mmetsp:Transcript_8986/g.10106  ORF Transcript_8986/g.10106 Transcript_8986/m.10106 type:complete len:110 (+) Transcript_8986:18-347(+)
MGNTLQIKDMAVTVNATSCFNPRDKENLQKPNAHEIPSPIRIRTAPTPDQLQKALEEIRGHEFCCKGKGPRHAETCNWLNRGFLNQEIITEGSRRKETNLKAILEKEKQ